MRHDYAQREYERRSVPALSLNAAPHMTIGQIIKELWERSKADQGEYASILRCTRNHLNAVIQGREDGSPDMLERALKHAGLAWNDCLYLPPDPETETENEKLLRLAKIALATKGYDRDHVVDQLAILRDRIAQRERDRKRK